MNPLFLLGRDIESIKVELLLSYFYLEMVNNSMENIFKRWKYFPVLYLAKLFLREHIVSPRVFEKHNNVMNLFLLGI